jgi:superfamily II DNA or RNA helicase
MVLASGDGGRKVGGLSLWPHQAAAVGTCQRYFAAGGKRSALVQMPTRTGKTGVMAVVSAVRASNKPVLVVCPSRALVNQLTTDVGGAFWRKIGADPAWAPDRTPHLLPSNVGKVAHEASIDGLSTIVFATVQGMQQIHAGSDYKR